MSGSTRSPDKRILHHYGNLDLLRHLLASITIYAHCFLNPTYSKYWIPLLPVPAFVCISGFLIPASFSDSRNWGHFAWKRILRVMPAFFAALVLVAVLSGPERLPSVLLSYASLGMLGWGMGNAPLWSLALEEILYTFHAGSRVIMRIYNLAVVLFCFVIVCTLWWYYRDLALPGRVPLHRLAGPVAAFFAGNILYFVWPKLKSVKVWAAFLALAAMSVFWFIPEKPYSILMAKVVLQSAAAVLLCLALPQMKVRIPDVSYGLYIYHWPVMMAVIGLGLRRWELFGATFAITLLLSTLSCFALERPALRLKNWRLKRDSGAPELEPGKAEVDTEASLLAMRP